MAEMNAYVAMAQSVLGNAEVRICPPVTAFLCIMSYASIAIQNLSGLLRINGGESYNNCYPVADHYSPTLGSLTFSIRLVCRQYCI